MHKLTNAFPAKLFIFEMEYATYWSIMQRLNDFFSILQKKSANSSCSIYLSWIRRVALAFSEFIKFFQQKLEIWADFRAN